MTGSRTSSPRDDRSRGFGLGGLPALREIVEQLRSPGEPRPDVRSERNDVRAAVLTALAERSGSGYEVVRLLEERGDDAPAPSAGEVYPTLQLLADEGLVTAVETDGRRTWSLTPAGRTAAEGVRDRPTAWRAEAPRGSERRGAIARSSALLAQTVGLAAQDGTPAQVSEVVRVLDGARREILSILARG